MSGEPYLPRKYIQPLEENHAELLRVTTRSLCATRQPNAAGGSVTQGDAKTCNVQLSQSNLSWTTFFDQPASVSDMQTWSWSSTLTQMTFFDVVRYGRILLMDAHQQCRLRRIRRKRRHRRNSYSTMSREGPTVVTILILQAA